MHMYIALVSSHLSRPVVLRQADQVTLFANYLLYTTLLFSHQRHNATGVLASHVGRNSWTLRRRSVSFTTSSRWIRIIPRKRPWRRPTSQRLPPRESSHQRCRQTQHQRAHLKKQTLPRQTSQPRTPRRMGKTPTILTALVWPPSSLGCSSPCSAPVW